MRLARFFLSDGLTRHGRTCYCRLCTDGWTRFASLWSRIGECQLPMVMT